MLETMLTDAAFDHVTFDLSWDEVAKYIVSSPEVTQRSADLLNRYPSRFQVGSDTVAPASAEKYSTVYDLYVPLWKLLTPATSLAVRKGNYERIFDKARRDVRAWEKMHAKQDASR
jgi:hypothetical protein